MRSSSLCSARSHPFPPPSVRSGTNRTIPPHGNHDSRGCRHGFGQHWGGATSTFVIRGQGSFGGHEAEHERGTHTCGGGNFGGQGGLMQRGTHTCGGGSFGGQIRGGGSLGGVTQVGFGGAGKCGQGSLGGQQRGPGSRRTACVGGQQHGGSAGGSRLSPANTLGDPPTRGIINAAIHSDRMVVILSVQPTHILPT